MRLSCSILLRLSKGTIVTSTMSLPPMSSHTPKVLPNAVPKSQSEPWAGTAVPKKDRAWLLPPIATVYPDDTRED